MSVKLEPGATMKRVIEDAQIKGRSNWPHMARLLMQLLAGEEVASQYTTNRLQLAKILWNFYQRRFCGWETEEP